MSQSGSKMNHAKLKHAKTMRMIERNYQKLKQTLKINVAVDKAHWDR